MIETIVPVKTIISRRSMMVIMIQANESTPLPALSETQILAAKNGASLNAFSKKPYETRFQQKEPRLLDVEKDYFFKLVAASELGIDSKIPSLGPAKLPENLTGEQQVAYSKQIEMVMKHYDATQIHIQATALNRARLTSIPNK